jgi:hypothetical protein
MKIRPVGAELSHVDRRTGMTKVIVTFRNFAKAKLLLLLSLLTIVCCSIFYLSWTLRMYTSNQRLGWGSLKCHSLGVIQQTSFRLCLYLMRSLCNEFYYTGSSCSRRWLLSWSRKIMHRLDEFKKCCHTLRQFNKLRISISLSCKTHFITTIPRTANPFLRTTTINSVSILYFAIRFSISPYYLSGFIKRPCNVIEKIYFTKLLSDYVIIPDLLLIYRYFFLFWSLSNYSL